jgi:hypothetical protein
MKWFFLALSLVYLPSVPAAAADFWWIDEAISSCKAHGNRYSALAGSSLGYWWCTTNPDTAEGLRDEAVSECNRAQPRIARSRAPCGIFWENGKIVDTAFYEAMTREYRTPINIESHDGVTGETTQTDGFLVAGKSRKDGETYLSLATITLADGTPVCRGVAQDSRTPSVQLLDVICFESLRLRGKITISGLLEVDGYYRFAKFRGRVDNPPHWVKLSTR